MNRAKILLMFAGPYEIAARDGQAATSGCSVEYYFWGENGETLETNYSAENQPAGTRRSKANLSLEEFKNIVRVPALYDGDFEMKVGADGKPVMSLKHVEIDSSIDVSIKAVKTVKTN